MRRFLIKLIPIAVGISFIAWGAIQYGTHTRTAEWDAVIGMMLESTSTEEFNGDSPQAGVRHLQRVLYEYEVDGEIHQSTRISLNPPRPLPTETDGTVRLRYYPEEQCVVYYDPADPKEAVLERTSATIPVAMMIAGVAIIIVSIWSFIMFRGRGVEEVAMMVFLFVVLPGCDAVQSVDASTEGEDIEVALFEGGYGIHWHQAMADAYVEEYPQVDIELWGDPRIEQKTKPRFLQGDPPDVLHNRQLPAWLLIGNGKIRSFNDALTQPAPGSDQPWGDLFFPGTLDMYSSDGEVWSIPSAFNAWACWYDAKQFREYGWEPPKTWAEFDTLCAKMSEDGVAPLAFQGKYPIYAWWTYISVIQRCGGLAAVNRINACEPDAFSHPDVVWAAQLMQDMAQKHFQKGAMAMNHTESQLQFVNNSAAMVFCGLWLDNEMKESTPPNFEMRAFTVPQVEGGKGNPNLVQGSGWEFFLVPTDAENPDRAFDFVRYMVSPKNAQSMGETIGVISPLRDATPREAVSPALGSVIDILDDTVGIFSIRNDLLLPDWYRNSMNPAMAKLLKGEITAEEFCATVDAGLQESVARYDGPLPPYTPYDPADFGEPWD